MPQLSESGWAGLLASPWIHGPIAFVAWMTVFWVAQRVLISALRRVARRTRWTWNDVLIDALQPSLRILVVSTGLLVLGRILPLSPAWDRGFEILLAAGLALAMILFADRACRGLVERMARKTPILEGARGLVQGILRGIVVGIGILVFLDSVGISITPILASLGVGSLAVALALQETLANVFAGIHLLLDKPLEPGHSVRLEEGSEGVVVKVGWRSTWIRTLANNVVVVPNTTMTRNIITNFSLPGTELAVPVAVGVAYDSDLERVERVTLEVAREAMREAGGGETEPAIRYNAFGDSSVNFNVLLHAKEFASARGLQHEFVKRLLARYRREGIVIPFPIRTLDLPPEIRDGLRPTGFPGAGKPRRGQ